MAYVTCELFWFNQLLGKLRFGEVIQLILLCDNQVAFHIASNLVFHKRTRHIEIGIHFIREKILSTVIAIEFVNSNDRLAYLSTKSFWVLN